MIHSTKNLIRRVFTKSKTNLPNPVLHRMKNFAQNTKRLKLHFGCGPRILKGWVNIDLAFEPYEHYLQYYGDVYYPSDIRGNEDDFYAFDITKEPLPFNDNSVDVIFHEDFIEHLDQREQILFLAETYRVLKVGGTHRVNIPNLTTSMLEHSNFQLGALGVYVQEWDKHGHRNVLTANSISDMAFMVGYHDIKFTNRNESGSPDIPLEYRPDPNDRPEIGNIFADLIK